MVKHPLLFILLWVNGSILAQTPVAHNEAIEDINIAIAAMEECHPGLEIHLSKPEIQQIFSEWRSLTKEPVDLKTLYNHLLKGVSKIGDGHTDLLEGKRFQQEVPYHKNILPFRYKIIDDRVLIAEQIIQNAEIARWSEILSINGNVTTDILNTIYAHTPADGGNIGFKRAYNAKIFGRQYAKFFGSTASYDLVLKNQEGLEQKVSVKAVHDSLVHQEGYYEEPLKLEVNKEGNYALFTVNTFQYNWIRNGGLDFHEFLRSSFKKLKKEKIENLIIDLRENYGGDNILGLTLYSFLVQDNFKWMEPSTTKLIGERSIATYSNYPEGKFQFLNTHDVEDNGDGTHQLLNGIDSKAEFNSDLMFKGPGAKPENISKFKFDGEVYVLTSGLTFSAAAIFTSKVASSERATIVGEETGGAHSQFCGGGFYRVTLPNSKFVLQIPFMKRKVSGSAALDNSVATVPDLLVTPSVSALTNGEDEVLKAAVDLIKGKRNNR